MPISVLLVSLQIVVTILNDANEKQKLHHQDYEPKGSRFCH